MGMLEHSMRRGGVTRPPLLDADGNVIAGNKTVETAMSLGLTPRIIDVEPGEILLPRRKDLHLYDRDDSTARDLATADNRVAEVNLSWSSAMLAAAEERGSTASKDFWWADELVAQAEAEDAATEEAAEAEDAPLDPKARQVPRFQVVVTCPDESARVDLIDWLEAHDMRYREVK